MSQPYEPESELALSTTSPSVLVIDDEPDGFTVIKALLWQEGYNLTYVNSGQEALIRLHEIVPDVILLDIMMPNLDGLEVCRRIKSNPAWEHLPIIMVTALTTKQDLAHSLEAGAQDFITKPVNGLELRARVRSMLRIKQQYDELKATLQLREDMSSMIVHDLRNPMATILLSAELLKLTDFQEKELERVEAIEIAAKTLNSLVNDLLLMAKMEAGKLLLNQTEVDLNALSIAILSNCQELANSKQIHLESQLPDAGHWIAGDINLLYRLIDNLLSNAIKFSPVGSSVTLRVEYPAQSMVDCLPSVRARIEVSDQGFEVKEDLRQTIFKNYGVGDSISKASRIGLGLTFCKMVAEAHGGCLFVKDNQPMGSIFVVEI